MYQASTVFTGSEMPALICNGCGGGPIFCCAVAGSPAANMQSAANTPAKKPVLCILVVLPPQKVERARRRPMRRRKKDRVGVGMLPHQRAAHVDRGMARDAADLIERRAPTGCAQHLAAEMLGVAGDAVGL